MIYWNYMEALSRSSWNIPVWRRCCDNVIDSLIWLINEWITSIQPPGLMKMRLMHHQEHHLGHQAPESYGYARCSTALLSTTYGIISVRCVERRRQHDGAEHSKLPVNKQKADRIHYLAFITHIKACTERRSPLQFSSLQTPPDVHSKHLGSCN